MEGGVFGEVRFLVVLRLQILRFFKLYSQVYFGINFYIRLMLVWEEGFIQLEFVGIGCFEFFEFKLVNLLMILLYLRI